MTVPPHFAIWHCTVRYNRRNLVRGRLLSHLESGQDSVCLADYADYHRALLDGLLCIFDLKYPALGRTILVLATISQSLELDTPGGANSQSNGVVVIVISKHGCGGVAITVRERVSTSKPLRRDECGIACGGGPAGVFMMGLLSLPLLQGRRDAGARSPFRVSARASDSWTAYVRIRIVIRKFKPEKQQEDAGKAGRRTTREEEDRTQRERYTSLFVRLYFVSFFLMRRRYDCPVRI